MWGERTNHYTTGLKTNEEGQSTPKQVNDWSPSPSCLPSVSLWVKNRGFRNFKNHKDHLNSGSYSLQKIHTKPAIAASYLSVILGVKQRLIIWLDLVLKTATGSINLRVSGLPNKVGWPNTSIMDGKPGLLVDRCWVDRLGWPRDSQLQNNDI